MCASILHQAKIPTITVQYVRILTDYCQAQGLTMARLLREAGLAQDLLANTDARVAFADFMRLCEAAEHFLADANLALKVGQEIRPGHYGVHGYAVISSATVGEALQRSVRFYTLVHNGGMNELKIQGDAAAMIYHCNMPDMDDLGRFQNELCFSAWVHIARWATGMGYTPTAVEFRHPEPVDVSIHQNVFQCPVRFGASRNAIVFPAQWLQLPLPQANPTVLRFMDELSERYLLTLGETGDPAWLAQAQRFIAGTLPDGLPTHEQVARAIGMHAREFRLQLSRHDLLFSELLSSTQARLARSYMSDPTLSLTDITYLLGFSEQSAFNRAFKRWMGMAPGAYRQTLS